MQIKTLNKSFNSILSNICIVLLLLFTSCTQQSTNRQIACDTIYVNDPRSIIKLKVNSVRVDSSYSELTGDKMLDGITAFVNGKKTNSRWAVKGYPHYAMFYFNGLVTVNKIRINLFKGHEGFTNHIKLYNFSDLIYDGEIGDSLWNNIRLNFYGSSIFLEVSGPSKILIGKTNSWTDIGEVEFYGYP